MTLSKDEDQSNSNLFDTSSGASTKISRCHDQLSLMSNQKEGIFIGGDVRRVGFAAEAMRDGMIAAESIGRYLKGEDLKADRAEEFEGSALPERLEDKPQPELVWAPAEERLNFEPFEQGFNLEEAIREAKRCLHCGPCESCKACVVLELQPEIPEIELGGIRTWS